jgi:hypothetical protein
LLWAKVNALEILDIHVIGRGLIDQAEEQEEVPKVYADLYTVGVALAVFGQVAHLDLGRLRLVHKDMVTQTVAGGWWMVDGCWFLKKFVNSQNLGAGFCVR